MTDTNVATDLTAETADDSALSLTDIQNAVKVIDFAADQGAFKGWKTIEQVLVVRSRLNAFLEAAAAAAVPEVETTEAEVSADETTEN